MSEFEKSNILIVDDRHENLVALDKILKRPDLNIIKAMSGNDALAMVLEHDFALILLDVQMPEMDGFETAELLHGNNETKHIPIIFVTAINKEEKYVFKGYETGAVDYLFKPLDPDILQSKVQVFITLDREKKLLLDIKNKLNKTICELQDYKKMIEEKNLLLKDASIKDELTGLYNRRYMTEILEREFSSAKRYHTNLSCLLFDLDFFKGVNDNYGHAFGDLVLCGIAECIKQGTRKQDFFFRYGGEEFLVLLPNTGIEGSLNVAEKIRSVCEEKKHDDGTNSIIVTISVGVASYILHQPSDGKELIAFSDKALYRAKAEGRNRVAVYMVETASESPEGEIKKDKDIAYLKENLSSILEKTKKASLESLELMVRDLGSTKYQKHNQQVKQYIALIGEKLNLPPSIIETFKRASTIHDCFKVLLEKILTSKKKELSVDEKAEVENHPYMLAELTELFDFLLNERSVLLHHHENFNGTGYPEGLKNDEIPLGARIFSIADALVAMLSDRPYRKGLPIEKVIEELADNAGTQFDPMLITVFLNIIEEKKLFSLSNGIIKNAKEKTRVALMKSREDF